jgi:hypothetical protein
MQGDFEQNGGPALDVSLAWAYHSPTNVHIYSLVAEHIGCSVMSLLV